MGVVSRASLGDGWMPGWADVGGSDSGGEGNEVIKGVLTDGVGSGLGIARSGGGVVPIRLGAEASLESGARLDNLRPLESVDGLMKIELERKLGWLGWCWKGDDSLSKPY
jgi:hypothetical protein